MANFTRNKKLINSSLQLKMIAVFMSIAATTSLFQVVLLNSALTNLAKDMPEAGDAILRELPRIMLSNVGLTVAVLVPLMFAVGLLITHRIAGPAHRMQTYCEAITRGEAIGPCRIRKEDELWDLCDALNEAIDTLRAQQVGRGIGPKVDAPALAESAQQERKEAA